MFKAMSLFRLPESKAIVFSIRTYQRYLSDFRNLPLHDIQGLIKAIDTLDPDFYVYKGAEFWKDAALQYLHMLVNERQSSFPSKLIIATAAVGAAAFLVKKYLLK